MGTLEWRKSSRSGTGGLGGQECVEAARLDANGIGLRDSKNPDAGHLALSLAGFTALLADVKRGEPVRSRP